MAVQLDEVGERAFVPTAMHVGHILEARKTVMRMRCCNMLESGGRVLVFGPLGPPGFLSMHLVRLCA